MRSGGAAEDIRPAEHVTLGGSTMRPQTPKIARLGWEDAQIVPTYIVDR